MSIKEKVELFDHSRAMYVSRGRPSVEEDSEGRITMSAADASGSENQRVSVIPKRNGAG